MAWMRYIYSFGLMLVILPCLAQYDFHNKPKIEKSVHVGGAYFYGDIGGRQKNALLLFGYEELDFSATKPTIGVGFKKKFQQICGGQNRFNLCVFGTVRCKIHTQRVVTQET